MNKLKLLIMSEQNDFDKRLSNTIKKFSSERNLFFTNLYNNSINWNSNTNLNDDTQNFDNNNKTIEKNTNKSFFRGTLLKRCKSTKEVSSSSSNYVTNHLDNKPIMAYQIENNNNNNNDSERIYRQSFNLDEFDKKYLFSQNRKNIVKELRKNFENNPIQTSPVQCAVASSNIGNRSSVPPPPPPRVTKSKPPKTNNVETLNSKKIIKSSTFNKCEFSANDLEKRLNENKNTNFEDIITPMVAHLPPPSSKQQRILTRHSFYLHRNDADIYEVGDGCDDCARVKQKARQLIEMFARNEPPFQPPLDNKINQKQIYNQGEINNNNNRNMNNNNRNNNNNNNGIINNNNNNFNNQNTNTNNNNECHADKTNIIKSNLDAIFVTRNNLLNVQHQQKRRSLNAAITRDNNLYRNILSDSFEDSKFGIKKSGSVNKIDLEILKSELDDYVDPTWRANVGLGYGFRSQRTLRGSRKELDLEQKIDLEIKMREGSAKLLAACNNSKNSSHHGNGSGGGGVGSVLLNSNCGSTNSHNTQILEAAKNLLTSNERMTAYMAELQRRKRDKDTTCSGKMKPSGKVSLSEIRMPLMWRDTDHFKNKGDHRRFAVFCLAKIGTEIYDTSLLCPVDRNLTDVCFNDAILFTNISPDFELKLEVYAVMMESDLSIASTPRKIKNTIHSSISRTVGRRLAANLKDELNNTKIGPKFELIATAHLTLTDASDSTHTHDLCLTPNNGTTVNANNKLPLFGHFCCRLAVQPDFYEQATHAGFVCVIQKGPTRPIDGYARLQAFRVNLWDDEKAFQINYQPRRSIAVTRETKVKLKGETDVVLINLEEGAIEEYILRMKSGVDAQKWYSAIKKAIKEHNQWDHVVLSSEPMQLAIPGNSKNYFLRSSRQGSLYDQVPILDSTEIRQSSRPTVQDIFAIPVPLSGSNNGSVGGVGGGDISPSLNDFRTRAYSSGRSSSHSSSTLSAGSSIGSINSRKSNWPFGNK